MLPGSDEIYFLFHQELCEIVERKLEHDLKPIMTLNDEREKMIDEQIEVEAVCSVHYREGFGRVLIVFA